MILTPEHKSKPPLRWFVNGVFHRISMYYFTKGLAISDKYGDQMTTRQYNKLLSSIGDMKFLTNLIKGGALLIV